MRAERGTSPLSLRRRYPIAEVLTRPTPSAFTLPAEAEQNGTEVLALRAESSLELDHRVRAAARDLRKTRVPLGKSLPEVLGWRRHSFCGLKTSVQQANIRCHRRFSLVVSGIGFSTENQIGRFWFDPTTDKPNPPMGFGFGRISVGG